MTQELNDTTRSWIVASLMALVAVFVVTAARPLLIDAGPPLVHIRWRADVGDPERRALEERLGLRPIRHREGSTWEYELKDISTSNVQALVRNRAVDDTHYIDRQQFTIESDAPRPWPRPGRVGRFAPNLAQGVAAAAVPVLGSLALVAAVMARRPDAARAVARSLTSFVSRGVPALSPFALAVFRLLFGTALAVYVAANLYPSEPFPLPFHRTDTPLVDSGLIHWLAASSEWVRAIQGLSIAAAVLFAVGVRARTTYAATCAGIVLWMLVRTLREGSHQFGVLLIPLFCLMAVPWGEAPGVHEWRGRGTSAVRSRRYGYAPWLLSLTLGLAFAAAAWAKLREGPGWVLNGTVKYAFVADGEQARVHWGLMIATMPRVAVVISAAAVMTEALVIASAFVRGAAARLTAGLAATALLTGFFLFQGVLWPAWWILLLGFLPWQWMDDGLGARILEEPPRLSRAETACAVALIGIQIVVSGWFVDLEPVASRYDMYSTTRSSSAQFDREEPDVRRRVVAIGVNGVHSDITGCLSHRGNALRELWAAATAGGPPPTTPLAECAKGLVASRFRLLQDERAFDWTAGRFYWRYRDRTVAEIAASP